MNANKFRYRKYKEKFHILETEIIFIDLLIKAAHGVFMNKSYFTFIFKLQELGE